MVYKYTLREKELDSSTLKKEEKLMENVIATHSHFKE